MQPGAVVLQIHEWVHSSETDAEVIVRSLTGELWRGATVHVTDADHKVITGPLTVATIWRSEQHPIELLDPIHAGKLRLVGPVGRIASAAAWVVGD